jgi:hypothetical protein
MRVYILTAGIVALAFYALRYWFGSLCALIVMSAFVKHGDMPKVVLGIPGANPWNLLLVAVIVGWLRERFARHDVRPVPMALKVAVALFAALIVIAYVRGVVDLGSYRYEPGEARVTAGGFTTEYLFNPLKYLVEACMFFDGLRTQRAFTMGMYALAGQAVGLSLMAVKYIPIGALVDIGRTTSQGEIAYRGRFQREIGFQANDAALVLVAGFWLLVVSWPVLRAAWRPWRILGPICCLLCALAICLTNSRGGYLAVVVVGLFLGVVRWKRMLIAVPVAALVIFLAFPAVATRATLGFGERDVAGQSTENLDAISGGRTTDLWPPVIEQIERAPLFGCGRMTIFRTSVYEAITHGEGGCPDHPHSAYLEMLMDCGLLGLLTVLPLLVWLPVAWERSARRRARDPVLDAARYAGLAGVVTILIMGTTGQTFWPREGVEMIMCLYTLLAASYVLGWQKQLAGDSTAISASVSAGAT